MKRVNSDEQFIDLRKTGRNATYSLHMEREPEKGIAESFKVGFSVIGGRIDEVWTGHDKSTEFTDLVFSGKYSVWVDIIRNRLSLTEALLSRKLNLLGETNEMYGPTVWMSPGPLFGVGVTAATERIIEIARQIPTQFHGKYFSSETQS